MSLYPLNGGGIANAKPPLSIAFNYGMQTVDVKESSHVDVTSITGRTLVNLLGNRGDCEDPSRWGAANVQVTLDATNKTHGGNGFKVEVSKGSPGFGNIFHRINAVDKSKHYVAVADVRLGTGSSIQLIKQNISGDGTSVFCTVEETSKFVPAVLRIAPEHFGGDDTIAIAVNGAPGSYGYCDAIRMYEITKDEYDAVPTMSAEQVTAKYPYVDSLQNVVNPYIIGYGENLAGGFERWVEGTERAFQLNSSREMSVTASSTGLFSFRTFSLRVKAGQSYTFSVDVESAFTKPGTYGTYLNVHEVTPSGERKAVVLATTSYSNKNGKYRLWSSFTPQYENIILTAGLDSGSTGTFILRDPMLTMGAESKPFTPHKETMIALTTELASNADGTVADELFERDGQYWKVAKWKKVTLDGSLSWEYNGVSGVPGFKGVRVNRDLVGGIAAWEPTYTTIKFDGSVLRNIPVLNEADSCLVNGSDFVISVHNNDSGWGENYTPTNDEIRAYFYGWRMYDGTQGVASIYNGTGTKWWARRNDLGAMADGVNILPTVQAPISKAWRPYQIQYRNQTPVAEHVPHEGKLVLRKGVNLVECGVCMEVRERVTPMFIAHETSGLASVPFAGISGRIAANLRGTINDLVEDVSELDARICAVERKDTPRPPKWVKATLLNGWSDVADVPVYYSKDATGAVRIAGRVKSGLFNSGTIILVLPKGCRPYRTLIVPSVGFSSSGLFSCEVSVDPLGQVSIWGATGNHYVDITLPSFIAEQ